MSNILIVTVAFTTDEAEFLSSVLVRHRETTPPGSAERFWLERLQNRVQQDLMDIVANDSAARLAASSVPASLPSGFPPMPAPPPAPASSTGSSCTCGHLWGSTNCHKRKQNGTHP